MVSVNWLQLVSHRCKTQEKQSIIVVMRSLSGQNVTFYLVANLLNSTVFPIIIIPIHTGHWVE